MGSAERDHNYSYDLLRIIAILCVLFNHTKQYGFELYTVTSDPFSRYGSLLLAVLCKIGVPLFLMVSGALLLGKEESAAVLMKKRVGPFAAIFAVMFLLQYFRVYRAGGYDSLSVTGYLKCLLYDDPIAPYWFLRSYLVFLLTLPFLRAIAGKMNREWFFLLLALQIVTTVLEIITAATGLPNRFSFFPAASFVFYPLAGHYLSVNKEETERLLRWFLPLSVLSLAVSAVVISRHSLDGGSAEPFFGPVWLYAIVFFLIVNRHTYRSAHPILKETGSCVFGIYLIEDIVRNRLEFLVPLLSGRIGALPACLLYVAAVFLASAVTVWIGRKVPVVRFFLHS